MNKSNTSSSAELKRTLGLPLLTLYGLGTVLGAGIYVLIGEVAGRAGILAPLSFLIASALSALTAFSFAELGGRFPKSAGEAVYVLEGFGRRELSLVIGLMVAVGGIVSSAAIAQGFAGYLHSFVEVPDIAAEVVLITVLTGLAVWGIAESVTVAALLTVVEAGALVAIITFGLPGAVAGGTEMALPPAGAVTVLAVLSGAVLAFYAFIGFEDMVNVAEEVVDAPRTIGRAILIVVIATTLLYVGVAFVAVRTVSPADLAASTAPLALLFERITHFPPQAMSLVALLAVVNGALIQMIMAARVLYGLARQNLLPNLLGEVDPRTRTPVKGTLIVGAAVLVAALALPLVTLAELTSALILMVFTIVNLALIMVKRRGPAPDGVWEVPLAVPALGAASAAIFAVFAIAEVFRA